MWRDGKCSLSHNLSNEICPEYVAPISASYFSYFLASCHNFNTVSFLILRGLNKQGYKCRRKLLLLFLYFFYHSVSFFHSYYNIWSFISLRMQRSNPQEMHRKNHWQMHRNSSEQPRHNGEQSSCCPAWMLKSHLATQTWHWHWTAFCFTSLSYVTQS